MAEYLSPAVADELAAEPVGKATLEEPPSSPDVVTASLEAQTPASPDAQEPASPDLEPESPDNDDRGAAEMQKIYGKTLMELRDSLGDTHPKTLTALNNRAASLFAKGDVKSAAKLFKEAIIDKRGVFGAHASTAVSLANLGKLYKSANKPKRAREYLQEAYEMREDLLGKRHPDTLRSMNHLGGCLQKLKELDGAEKLLTDALKRSRKALGNTDPVTLTSINNLGSTLHSKGDYEKSKVLLEEGVKASRDTLGPDHMDTLISVNNLGILLQDMAAAKTKHGAGAMDGPDATDAFKDADQDGEDDDEDPAEKAERRRKLLEEGAALIGEAARGFHQKREELGDVHPFMRWIGSEWEADLDLSAATASVSKWWGGGGNEKVVVDEETRRKLREVFDKFDEDGSNAVSTAEMKNMIKQLKLNMTDEEIEKLMVEADPDGSGQIEFEEFVTVMAAQMAKGGGLADVVTAASDFFGMLNPFNWFSGGDKKAEEEAPSKEEDETRKKLRMVFEKFDADNSGAVSTAEMKNMISFLELKLSDEEIAKLMTDADPDGSGQIEFEEFVTVMRSQMDKGGGLADVVAAAGNAFGWLNPMSWFGK